PSTTGAGARMGPEWAKRSPAPRGCRAGQGAGRRRGRARARCGGAAWSEEPRCESGPTRARRGEAIFAGSQQVTPVNAEVMARAEGPAGTDLHRLPFSV